MFWGSGPQGIRRLAENPIYAVYNTYEGVNAVNNADAYDFIRQI